MAKTNKSGRFPRDNERFFTEWWGPDERGMLTCFEMTNCYHLTDPHGKTRRILYAATNGKFLVRDNEDGLVVLKPDDHLMRRKQAGKPLPPAAGGGLDCPFMWYFDRQLCHKLMAFAFVKRPEYVNVNGVMHKCVMDFERGRMYYWDILLDAQGKPVRDENGNRTFIRVYLQIDHLNGDHGDYSPDNLEYITATENIRRRYKVSEPLKAAGLDPKKMPYKLLRNFFKQDGMLNERIRLVRLFFGDMFNLDKQTKQ